MFNTGREEQVNEILKTTRERSGKTQSQVAKEVGISERVYQSYEYDKCVPSVRTAIRIAQALGTTVEALFQDSQPNAE